MLSPSKRLLLLSAAAAVGASQARAQTAPAESVLAAATAQVDSLTPSDIIVTARRQSERAQDVPIALSVVSGPSLEQTGAYTLTDLQIHTPSLVAYNTNPRNSSVGIRGIGVSSAADGLDTSVGVYVDNVYLGRPGMALEDLIDTDRVEVLRGPQGTLFGRNTSAGVLNVTTRKPSFTLGSTVEASVGDYGYNQERISLTGPIVHDLLAFRLTAFNTHRDGVLPNTTTGSAANSIGRTGARLQFLLTPSPKVSVRLIGEYSRENDTCCVSVLRQVAPASLGATTARTLSAFSSLGYTPVANLLATPNNAPQNMRTDQHAGSAEVSWDLGWADATSISAYRYWHFDPLQDSDGTPLDIIQVNVAKTRDHQLSQEIRLASKPGRLSWQVGGYLFGQTLNDHYVLNQFGTDASAFYTAYLRTANPAAPAVSIAPGSQYIGDTRATTFSGAAFGQANFKITERLILTGGVRYTYDRKHGVSDTSTVGTPYAATSIPFHYDVTIDGGNVSWLANASYKLAKDSLLYASYSTGYKSAGLNLNSAVSASTPLILQPEHVKDWEVGLKTTLLQGRVSLNLDGYWTDLSGLQANIYPTNGAKSYLANVGDIRARGAEADVQLIPVDGLELSLNGSYNDSTYRSYTNGPCPVGVAGVCNLTGLPVYESPKWIGNATVRYSFDLNRDVRPYVLTQVSRRSGAYGTVDDGPLTQIPAYTLVNARIGAAIFAERYDLSLWVNNAFDQTYFLNLATASIPGASTFGVSGQLGTRRTFGATVRASF